MLISNTQFAGIAGSTEDQFASSLMAQQTKAFPQLQDMPSGQLPVQTAASIAVAQLHGFSKQQDIATCATCVLPFVTGAAQATDITGEGAQALQTLVADTKNVVSALAAAPFVGLSGGGQVAALAKQCSALAAALGSKPLNMDRSGPVVPFTEQSPVKSGDLIAPALSALSPQAGAPSGAVTREQMETAAAAAQNNFPDTVLGSVVQNCKQLVDLEFRRVYWDGMPIPNLPYKVTLADGSIRSGTTDGNGLGSHSSVPQGYAKVVYGENKNPAKASVGMDVDPDFQEFFSIANGGPAS